MNGFKAATDRLRRIEMAKNTAGVYTDDKPFGAHLKDMQTFISAMLDPTPITEEAVLAVGFFEHGTNQWRRLDAPGRLRSYSNRTAWYFVLNNENSPRITTVGQLHMLVMSLGDG